jgi:hypothetical protein
MGRFDLPRFEYAITGDVAPQLLDRMALRVQPGNDTSDLAPESMLRPTYDARLRQYPLDFSTLPPQLLLDLVSDWMPEGQASRSDNSRLIDVPIERHSRSSSLVCVPIGLPAPSSARSSWLILVPVQPPHQSCC